MTRTTPTTAGADMGTATVLLHRQDTAAITGAQVDTIMDTSGRKTVGSASDSRKSVVVWSASECGLSANESGWSHISHPRHHHPRGVSRSGALQDSVQAKISALARSGGEDVKISACQVVWGV